MTTPKKYTTKWGWHVPCGKRVKVYSNFPLILVYGHRYVAYKARNQCCETAEIITKAAGSNVAGKKRYYAVLEKQMVYNTEALVLAKLGEDEQHLAGDFLSPLPARIIKTQTGRLSSGPSLNLQQLSNVIKYQSCMVPFVRGKTRSGRK